MEVPVRELKNKLSAYLRLVAEGHKLIVTSHKRPIAQILPPEQAQQDEDRALERLLGQPWLSGGTGELLPSAKPLRLTDRRVLAADVVLEGRD
jgi:prevent-host-death family protein